MCSVAYIDHARLCVCVCLSLASFPQYYTDPDISLGNGGGAPSCALLSEFPISARVLLLWQHTSIQVCNLIALYSANVYSAKRKMSVSASLYLLYACLIQVLPSSILLFH